jgi:hypothetical protein
LQKDSEVVRAAIDNMKEAGFATLWNSTPNLARRTVYTRELASMGIKNPEALAIPTSQNDVSLYGSTTFAHANLFKQVFLA